MKPKACKVCREKFQPARQLQSCCSVDCAIQHSRKLSDAKAAKDASERRASHRDAKVKAKTRGEYVKDAQTAFNAYIRARDKLLPCISCGRFHDGQWHAGHYMSVGSSPEKRFNTNNCNRQCSPCNLHLHGNLINYRIGLIARIGLDQVEILESKTDAQHYSIDDLKNIKEMYKNKLKELASL